MVLYGASGHGKVVLDVVQSSGQEVQCFIDDAPVLSSINSTPVVSATNIENYLNHGFIISIGNNAIRKKISVEKKLIFAKAVCHNTSIISRYSKIGAGSVVMPLAVVNANAVIGKHCIINTAAIIEHDCKIANYAHISPNATLAGGVSIGEGTQIGIGASIIPGVTIGKWCVVGAGATVINDIPDYSVAVGSPATVIKKNK